MTGDRQTLVRASIHLDNAIAPMSRGEEEAEASKAILELADYLGATVVFPDDDPGGEADDGGGN